MTRIARRSLLAAGAATLAAPALTRANSFPNGPIRILVPFGPGSVTDQSARAVADGLNRRLGATVVVDNKPGANGAIAADVAAKSKPDGQTIFVCSNTAAASNVGLTLELPQGLKFLEATGPSAHASEKGLVTFRPVGQLGPGESATFTLKVKGQASGNVRLRSRLTSDSIDEPIVADESTKFYQ